nr:putative ribonuclease H-like domain-containing protein [Tanacetum cinerariifolium]
MLADSLLPTIFWSKAVATACYVLNRVLVTKPHHKTPYELLTRDKPFISYLKPFGCLVTILNTSDSLGKFDKKLDEGTGQAWMFDINYLTDSLNYPRVGSTNLTSGSQGATPSNAGSQEDDSDSDDEPDVLIIQSTPTPVVPIVDEATTQNDDIKSDFAQLNVDNLDELTELQALQSTPSVSAASTPQMSPCASPISADQHSSAAGKCHVPAGRPTGSTGRPVSTGRPTGSAGRPIFAGRPSGFADRSSVPVGYILGLSNASTSSERFSRASSMNKSDIHDGLTIFDYPKNKARLVAQSHRQEEGIDYTDVFAPVAKIEAIRLFLAFASFIGFKLYQMDVKSSFLYGEIAEEVYVTQPKGFEDPDYLKRVYKVIKALYGLHQAPRAWYERLSTFLLKHVYIRGSMDQTLFIKKDSNDIMLVQVYVDDIIFNSTRKDWSEEFKTLMQSEFEMSSMGPLTFFLGLQVDQRLDGIFIHQEKYGAEILKKFDLNNSKLASTPFEPQKFREKNVPDEPISVYLYRSMIGCLMYLTATRPVIMFVVCAAARHQVTPKTSNHLSVKRIFNYLTAYPKLGLWYPRDSPFDLEAFFDSDYDGAHGDKKSTTDGSEYMAAASCCGQWLLVTSAGRVIFCWLIVILAGDLVPAGG